MSARVSCSPPLAAAALLARFHFICREHDNRKQPLEHRRVGHLDFGSGQWTAVHVHIRTLRVLVSSNRTERERSANAAACTCCIFVSPSGMSATAGDTPPGNVIAVLLPGTFGPPCGRPCAPGLPGGGSAGAPGGGPVASACAGRNAHALESGATRTGGETSVSRLTCARAFFHAILCRAAIASR